MRSHAKAPSAGSIFDRSRNRGIGLIGACVLAFVALLGSGAPAAGADSCHNAAIRVQQHSTHLPGCRAFEMVSPPEKNDSDINYTASRTRIAPDGGKITYTSVGAFANAVGTGSAVQYMATRGAGGWVTHPITPPQRTNELSAFSNHLFVSFSDDLRFGAFRQFGGSAVTGGPNARNLFVRDDSNGSYRLISDAVPGEGVLFGAEPYYVDATDDFSHATFTSKAALTPDAPNDGLEKLYERVNGSLRLVGILPDPDGPGPLTEGPAPEGAIPGAGIGSDYRFETQATMFG